MKICPVIGLAGFFIASVLCFSCCVYEGVVSNNSVVTLQGRIDNSTADSYYLDISSVDDLENWTRIYSYSSINSTGESDVLASLNTSLIGEGRYGLRITAAGVNNTSSSDLVYLTVEGIHHGSCPVYSCNNLSEGNNYVDFGVDSNEYINWMDCSFECACPSGLYGYAYTNGSLEYYYDYINITEEPENDAYYPIDGVWELTGDWSIYDDWVSGLYTSANGGLINISFHSDYSNNGSDGYSGFEVSNLVCSPYSLKRGLYYYDDFEPYVSRIRLNSGNATPSGRSYEDLSGSVLTTLETGKNYNLSLDIETRYDYSGYAYLKAWIDYNKDYLFNSSTEEIDFGQINVSGNTTLQVDKNFSVPYTSKTGGMRLRLKVYSTEDEIDAADIPYTESLNGALNDYTLEMVQGSCQLNGDNPPCSQITLREVVNLINRWLGYEVSLSEVVRLINAWVSS